jgi:hypothetical protein
VLAFCYSLNFGYADVHFPLLALVMWLSAKRINRSFPLLILAWGCSLSMVDTVLQQLEPLVCLVWSEAVR